MKKLEKKKLEEKTIEDRLEQGGIAPRVGFGEGVSVIGWALRV